MRVDWATWLAGLAGLFLVLSIYTLRVEPELARNTWATDDEIAYLNGGIEIRERWGGPVGLLRGLLDGTFTRAERGPLYMALLSTFAERSLAMFDRARALDFWLGLAGLTFIFLAAWRWYGLILGIALGLVLATNPHYLNSVAVVGAEVIFIPLVALTLLVLARGMRHPAWLPIGFALVGLSFLAKSNGFFLIVPALLAWAVARGRRFWREQTLWLALAAFLLIASPLMIRNLRMTGNPLYNANTRLMWIDQYETSRTEAFRQHGASMIDYLRTHSVADMARRLIDGTRKQLTLQAQMLGGPVRSQAVGYVLLALAIIGYLAVGPVSERVLFGLAFAEFILFFGWMTRVWFLPHYTLPVVPTTYLVAFRAIGEAAHRLRGYLHVTWRLSSGWRGHPATLRLWALFALGLAGMWVIAAIRLDIPPAREAPEVAALREWLVTHLTPEDRYILGPEREFRMEWYADLPGQRYSVPAMSSLEELLAYMDEHRIDWLIVTPRQYARRLAVFQDWILYHEPDKFMYARPLAGWELVDYDRTGETIEYLIYRRNPDALQRPIILRETPDHIFHLPRQPMYPADVNFGDRIALRGFDMSQTEIRPGQEMEVTLYWQRLGRMRVGYTAFVHLLDETESRVWGQQDKPPREGAYPTYEWLLDEVLVETYRFVVPPETPPGTYKLEVGWYEWQTGRRLPVRAVSERPSEDRFLLPVSVQVRP
ncbi:MAG TPA: glycosyltransferase family 39 protein [Caldilineae bacterium]|nr:glycosyltransferase family 39 protein [Caldilineae bacterium]